MTNLISSLYFSPANLVYYCVFERNSFEIDCVYLRRNIRTIFWWKTERKKQKNLSILCKADELINLCMCVILNKSSRPSICESTRVVHVSSIRAIHSFLSVLSLVCLPPSPNLNIPFIFFFFLQFISLI